MKKLAIFDFDGTLFDTLEPISGKELWQQKTGTPYPHQGWWSKPESLDITILDEIKPIDYIYERYKQHKQNNDYVYLATGRLIRLEKEVLNILNQHGITFDGIYLNNEKDTLSFKLKLFDKLIHKHRNDVDGVIIYEDREEHISEFDMWRKHLKEDVKIYNVNTKKVL